MHAKSLSAYELIKTTFIIITTLRKCLKWLQMERLIFPSAFLKVPVNNVDLHRDGTVNMKK